MLAILTVTFPFFALIACGYAATRLAWLPVAAVPGLNTFVLYFALPCMLYRFGAATPMAQLPGGALVAVYLFSALVVVALTVAFSRQRGVSWNDAAFGALVAAFPNTGFMGVPLLVTLLGAAAAGPAIVSITIDMMVTSSLCIALSRLGNAGDNGPAHAARLALRGVAGNPLPWAIGLGALSSATGLTLPRPLMATVALLADAASPVALFAIGALLARSQINSKQPAYRSGYLPIVLIKLVLHPALLGAAGLGAIALGLPLTRFSLTVLVLVGALPSASNVALLAERFGADSDRIARIILLSTVLAFFSFSAAVAWLV